MDWQEVIKEAFKRLGKEVYTNPYADDIATLEKEIVRLQEIQRGVEIPSKNASVKDFQARIQAKALYAEINSDLSKVISEHNHLIESSKAHFVDFKQEIVEVIQSVNTVPTVDYGHHGKIGLDDETYKTLLFDANEGQIAEYFEVLASQEQYEMNGSTRILKGFFDPNREAVSSFIDNYSLSKEDILAIVATSNEILKEEERKQRESITQALLEKSPDVQSYSRNYTGEQETKVDADGTINLGSLTTKGTVFINDEQQGNATTTDSVTGVEVSRV